MKKLPAYYIASFMLMIFGALFFIFPDLQTVNMHVRMFMVTHFHGHYSIDNYLQYLCAAVFLLCPGKLKWWERILLFAFSLLIFQGISESLKSITGVLRPDGSKFNSFPSGHTGTAFVGATLLALRFRKYKWLVFLVFCCAASVGMLRMMNNRHWLNDVAFGAGLGMMVAYSLWILWHKYIINR